MILMIAIADIVEYKINNMTYKRVAKKKPDLSKNPDTVDTSKGREFLLSGKVKILKKWERNIT